MSYRTIRNVLEKKNRVKTNIIFKNIFYIDKWRLL